ncbi:MAG: hypothetical protein NWF04_04340 [Candidatus Bathyarchaeota archaeon]|nr:hypothetical protein [Candidatus Bathyarchaeota archaeon]
MNSKDPSVPKNPKTCPGLREFLQPTVAYIQCHVCGSELEIWSDEDETTCSECGAQWKRPSKNAACLEYCQYAEQCRGIIEARKK